MKTLQKKSVAALGYRVSVSLNDDQHAFLSGLAERKRVSIAWVIRDAIERLIAEESPLFKSDSTRGEPG
ncbi:MAG: CopG family transcriptional regulator [Phycisphaeraceae bacterium]|nr:CopG family transcriptional regulator [Phycisphaeraceae bacterium]